MLPMIETVFQIQEKKLKIVWVPDILQDMQCADYLQCFRYYISYRVTLY